ncbi:hypothetical protein ABT246_38055 [Streptomyces sp. NPDC001553]|uniref:hypothetical protein n=1 Tax=Streptomyces sp. NPDC001553 TaxID=3154385 RepID=UPI00332D7057
MHVTSSSAVADEAGTNHQGKVQEPAADTDQASDEFDLSAATTDWEDFPVQVADLLAPALSLAKMTAPFAELAAQRNAFLAPALSLAKMTAPFAELAAQRNAFLMGNVTSMFAAQAVRQQDALRTALFLGDSVASALSSVQAASVVASRGLPILGVKEICRLGSTLSLAAAAHATWAQSIVRDWVSSSLSSVVRIASEFISAAEGRRLLMEAQTAFVAYLNGDNRPMRAFITRQLRLGDRLDDRCQALALALLEDEMLPDLTTDGKQIRRVLTRAARSGCDVESERQILRQRVDYIGDREVALLVPGPEELVMDSAMPWHENFENRHVLYTVGRLGPRDRDIARAWAENPPLPWTQASPLAGADPAEGESVRRKIKRHGMESVRRDRGLKAES